MSKALTTTAKHKGVNEHINSIGGNLRTKFSIHEGLNRYQATSAEGNSELIQLLDGLLGTSKHVDSGYCWWDIPPNKVITTVNAVIREFGVDA